MKISIFVKFFPPRGLAGAEIAAHNMAKYFTKKGHEVHVTTTLFKGGIRETIDEGFFVHSIPWSKIKFFGGFIYWINAFRQLKKIKPDIFHFQNIDIDLFTFFLIKIQKKPFVVWAQGSDVYFRSTTEKLKSKIVLKYADAVIALTEDMKNYLKDIYKKDILIIPNGIDLSNFENLSKDYFYTKFGFEKNTKIILYVGTFRPVKGLKYLIEAMKIIGCNEKRLIIIGHGEEKEDMEKLVKNLNLENCVTFLGKTPNSEVIKYMVSSDVFVLPSLSEGFPITILEAMASALPIVTTKVRGLPEIFKDGQNGFLVEPRNPEQLAEKILLILNDEDLRNRISKNNEEEVKKYDWKIVIDKLENLYFDILKKYLK
jgi:glycosyltransferase involved in cell wall biosynthesis